MIFLSLSPQKVPSCFTVVSEDLKSKMSDWMLRVRLGGDLIPLHPFGTGSVFLFEGDTLSGVGPLFPAGGASDFTLRTVLV